jgi:hypothetical protein
MNAILSASIRGADFILPIELPDGVSDLAVALMQKGYGETLRDATAKYPGDEAEQYGSICERNGKLYDGSYRFGGGGGGTRMDSETKADLKFWNARRGKGVKPYKSSDLEDVWIMQTALVLVANKVATDTDNAVDIMSDEHIQKYMDYIRALPQWVKIHEGIVAEKGPKPSDLPQLF